MPHRSYDQDSAALAAIAYAIGDIKDLVDSQPDLSGTRWHVVLVQLRVRLKRLRMELGRAPRAVQSESQQEVIEWSHEVRSTGQAALRCEFAPHDLSGLVSQLRSLLQPFDPARLLAGARLREPDVQVSPRSAVHDDILRTLQRLGAATWAMVAKDVNLSDGYVKTLGARLVRMGLVEKRGRGRNTRMSLSDRGRKQLND